ncbi:hypothetical protein ebA1551 [Aromatoleum aromaticum EbN1]|uniref:Uncharacterized protein n=1 Tax=Aromatoleum aromaticum (strain DSM 19018 / LMG 30748 / EbN1) TaxID=76114 RepID=Q5P6T7_AROAE|nr:hypothetical protein ebA1551 [Aromatoleum aromaticum EbN1]
MSGLRGNRTWPHLSFQAQLTFDRRFQPLAQLSRTVHRK